MRFVLNYLLGYADDQSYKTALGRRGKLLR